MGFANGGKNSNEVRSTPAKGKGSSSSDPQKAFTQDPKNAQYTASTDESSDEETSEEEVLSEHAEFDNIENDWQSEIELEACKDLFSDEHFNSLNECLNSMRENHFGFSFENVKKAFDMRYKRNNSSESGENGQNDHSFSMYEHIRVVNFFRLRGPHASKKLLEEFVIEGENSGKSIDFEKLIFSEETKKMWIDDAYLCPAVANDPLLEYWSYFEDEEEVDMNPTVCNNVIMELVPGKNDGKIAELDPELLESIRREG